MSFWLALLDLFTARLVSAGMPVAEARIQALSAILQTTSQFSGDRVGISEQPYALRSDIDVLVHRLVMKHGINGSAMRMNCSPQTINRAVARYRISIRRKE